MKTKIILVAFSVHMLVACSSEPKVVDAGLAYGPADVLEEVRNIRRICAIVNGDVNISTVLAALSENGKRVMYEADGISYDPEIINLNGQTVVFSVVVGGKRYELRSDESVRVSDPGGE